MNSAYTTQDSAVGRLQTQLLLSQELLQQYRAQSRVFQQWTKRYYREMTHYYQKKITHHLLVEHLYQTKEGTDTTPKTTMPATPIAGNSDGAPHRDDYAETDVTDTQWELIGPLLPLSNGRGRPYVDDRRTLNGVRFVLMHHIGWNHMPTRYGSYVTCWRRYVRWQSKGVWDKVQPLLQHDADHHIPQPSKIYADSGNSIYYQSGWIAETVYSHAP